MTTVPTPAPIEATASSVRRARYELADAIAALAEARSAFEATREALLEAEAADAAARSAYEDALARWNELGRQLEPEWEVTTTP